MPKRSQTQFFAALLGLLVTIGVLTRTNPNPPRAVVPRSVPRSYDFPSQTSLLLPHAGKLRIPQIGFGTWRLGADSANSVRQALLSGYRHIDTAVAYDNEAAIGVVLKESGLPREHVFITTKLLPSDYGTASTRRSFGESLHRLQTDYVDLYLLHAPGERWQESWNVLEELYEAKKARAIGVSNFDVTLLKQLMDSAHIKPAVVQNYFTPFHHDKAVVDYCKENGIVYEGFSTLGSDRSANSLLRNPTLVSISEKHHRTVAQIVLRWAVQKGVVVLPRSANAKHIVENAELWDFSLTDDDMELIEGLG